MTTTTDRVTPDLLRTLAQALGGTRAGDTRTFTWTDDDTGRQITLHLHIGPRRAQLAVDRIDSGPRSQAATHRLQHLLAQHDADVQAMSPSYVSATMPTPAAPLLLLHLVAVETGATFTAAGQ